jgi:hypothetical protein
MRRSALVLAIALAACAAHPVTAPSVEDGLPPLPDSVPSVFGNLPVVRLDNLRNMRGDELLGGFVPETRTVYIKRTIPSRKTAWVTYYHESCHVNVFWDTGLRNAMSGAGGDQLQDAICDAIAADRVRAMLGGKQ